MIIAQTKRYCDFMSDLRNVGEGSIFGTWALYLSFGTCYEVDIKQVCSSSIHKCNILMQLSLSDFVKCR